MGPDAARGYGASTTISNDLATCPDAPVASKVERWRNIGVETAPGSLHVLMGSNSLAMTNRLWGTCANPVRSICTGEATAWN